MGGGEIMDERPKCNFDGCNNLAKKKGKKKNGLSKFAKLCHTHHAKKYKLP